MVFITRVPPNAFVLISVLPHIDIILVNLDLKKELLLIDILLIRSVKAVVNFLNHEPQRESTVRKSVIGFIGLIISLEINTLTGLEAVV